MVHSTARGQVLLVTSAGRAFKTDVLPLPVLPEQAGTVSVRGGMSASELVPLQPGETVVGLAPLGEHAAGSPGLALGTRQGVVKVCAPEWPVRSDEFEVITLKDGDEVVGATWLDRRRGDPRLRHLGRVAAAVRRRSWSARRASRAAAWPASTSPPDAEVVFFGAVSTDDPQHGEPMVVTSTGSGVKVTPFALYPAKGRATGGVRAQRFLKGETRLVVAWVGPRPVGASKHRRAGRAARARQAPRRLRRGHLRPGHRRPPDRARLTARRLRRPCVPVPTMPAAGDRER